VSYRILHKKAIYYYVLVLYTVQQSMVQNPGYIPKQEAQLLQRDHATLSIIEYFAKSLKVIGNDTAE